MSKIWLYVAPFLVILQGIVCPNVELLSQRRGRSSYYTNGANDRYNYLDYVPSERQQQETPDLSLTETMNIIFGRKSRSENNVEGTTMKATNTKKLIPNVATFSISKPECEESDSQDNTFCTKSRNYPNTTELDALLDAYYPEFDSLFNNDVGPSINFSQRMGGEDLEFFCNSEKGTVYPELVKEKNMPDWLFVLQTDKRTQPINIEKCVKDTNSTRSSYCSVVEPRFGYKTRCYQEHKNYMLVVVNADNTIVNRAFSFPASCKCAMEPKNSY